MIIGNGLIAKSFELYRERDDLVIFASGVSDSQETSEAAFERERSLLLKTIQLYPDQTIIYFSTCSVYDPDVQSSAYVQHKLKLEQIISQACKHYYIFRFPQVVGKSNNSTLINYFCDKIKRSEVFDVWALSERNIVDSEDMFKIVNYIVAHKMKPNSIINVAAPKNHSTLEMVRVLERVLHKKAQYISIPKGASYKIDISFAETIFAELNIQFDDSYLEKTIRKYIES